MKNQYDVYLCRKDGMPTLTAERLKGLMGSVAEGKNFYIEAYLAAGKARKLGYLVPDGLIRRVVDDEILKRVAIKKEASLLSNKLDSNLCSSRTSPAEKVPPITRLINWIFGK